MDVHVLGHRTLPCKGDCFMTKMCKVTLVFACLAAACMLAGCTDDRTETAQADTETLYQVALLQSLTLGDYTGSVTVGELKQLGDTGLGTFDSLDGEMIVLDGVVYQALSDGSIAIPDDSVTVPFSDVTFFEEDGKLSLAEMDLEELKQVLDETVQAQGKNSFYMVRLEGSFDAMQVRSEYAQQEPYQPLDKVMETDQVIFDYVDISGTIIGLYCPEYMDKLNTPGWHFHFISEDRTKGGHILSLSLREGTAAYDQTSRFSMTLPNRSDFQDLDLAADLSEAIEKVETNN